MRKNILLILAACMIVSSVCLLNGCSNSDSAAATEIAVAGSEASKGAEAAIVESKGMIVDISTDNNMVSIADMSFDSMPNASDNKEQPPQMAGGNGEQPPQMPGGNNGQPPEKPSNEASGKDGEQPPQMPGGNNGQPPEKPSGEASGKDGQQPPQMAGGNSEQPPQMPEGTVGFESTAFAVTDATVITDKDGNKISLSDLQVNSFVAYSADNGTLLTLSVQTMDPMPGGGMGGGMGGGIGEGIGEAPSEYTSAIHYQVDAIENKVSQTSTGTDENIAWVSDGAVVELSGITASKVSDNSTGGDQSSFYGVGAAYLVTDGTLNISDSTVNTDSAGGTGVFAYGKGTANVSDCAITTKQNTSGGIHVAGGGTLNASNLTVVTSGESSAAIRSDRGSGTMTVDGGSYTSNGIGSPAVYSTADITVANADLTAANSEAVCIEGKNSLTLTDCRLSSNMQDNQQNDCKWSVILYQSMSGDSEEGTSVFSMTGGEFFSSSGGLFYTTNTDSVFTLESVKISTDTTPDFFLKCTGNSNQRGWGAAGANGAGCSFTAIDQEMNGDIIWDSISTLKLELTNGSILTGAVVDDESNAGNGGNGSAAVSIDRNSTWIVTGNSTVSALTSEGTIQDEIGNAVSVIGTDGTKYVSGTSAYTITVETYAGK